MSERIYENKTGSYPQLRRDVSPKQGERRGCGELPSAMTPCAFWRTRKPSVPGRVQLFFQILWFSTSPSVAHGVGSKDADNFLR